ncbi:hypothetical protein AB0J28_20380 [Streptosporangium canum]|uniref:hypothetical protein n=1 Tax=Streptosporangium canum TaxID=324952 RepID=UPI003420FDE4
MPVEPALVYVSPIGDLGALPTPGLPWIIVVIVVLAPPLARKLRKVMAPLIPRVVIAGRLTLSLRMGR